MTILRRIKLVLFILPLAIMPFFGVLMCGSGDPVTVDPPSGNDDNDISEQDPGDFTAPDPLSNAPTEHIILFIGDGMQLEHSIAGSRYLTGEDRKLVWDSFEHTAYVTTWDVNTYNRYAKADGGTKYDPDNFDPLMGYDPSKGGSAPYPILDFDGHDYFQTALPEWDGDSYAIPATDSAGAATAMATGHKTDDGNISWLSGDPADGALSTVEETFRTRDGGSIGIVSTVEFPHATPACFASHNRSRGNYLEIAHEIITSTKPDVVIGAGHPDWNPGYISPDDLQALRESDEYLFVERQKDINGGESLLNAATEAEKQGKKLFGLYGGYDGCFDHAVPQNSPGAPEFKRNEENPTLAEATNAALTVLSGDHKGFFLMVEQGDIDWANHYNDYQWMLGSVWDLNEAVKSAIDFVDKPDDDITWDNTLIVVTADHANSFMRIVDPSKLGMGVVPVMEGEAYHHQYPGGEITYGSTTHTNELVMLYAHGHHASLFDGSVSQRYPEPRIIDNTDIYKFLLESCNLY
jgi:alkaline phosphatase